MSELNWFLNGYQPHCHQEAFVFESIYEKQSNMSSTEGNTDEILINRRRIVIAVLMPLGIFASQYVFMNRSIVSSVGIAGTTSVAYVGLLLFLNYCLN